VSWKHRLKIVRPCPIRTQVVDQAGRAPTFDCTQCGKKVLNLSYVSEREATRQLAQVEPTSEACVIYRVDADGDVVFAAERACNGTNSFAPHLRAMAVAALGTAACLALESAPAALNQLVGSGDNAVEIVQVPNEIHAVAGGIMPVEPEVLESPPAPALSDEVVDELAPMVEDVRFTNNDLQLPMHELAKPESEKPKRAGRKSSHAARRPVMHLAGGISSSRD
jgi:hypothetical protein